MHFKLFRKPAGDEDGDITKFSKLINKIITIDYEGNKKESLVITKINSIKKIKNKFFLDIECQDIKGNMVSMLLLHRNAKKLLKKTSNVLDSTGAFIKKEEHW